MPAMRPAALALLLLAACGSSKPSGAPCEGWGVPIEGNTHVPMGQPVSYAHHPPSSGNHWPCWASWGVASQPLPEERWVHNLEHGGVVLLYRCAEDGGCTEARDALAQVLAAAPEAPTGGKRLVVTSDADLGGPSDGGAPYPVAAVAWGWELGAYSVSASDLQCFIKAHQGRGPEDEPAGPPDSCPP